MRVTCGKVVGDLSGDREQWLLVQVGAAQRQHQVGGTRAQRGQHDAGLSAQFAMHRGRDAGIGLVPHQDEIHSRAPQLVHQHEHFASRQSEDALDAGIGQESGGCCCGRDAQCESRSRALS